MAKTVNKSKPPTPAGRKSPRDSFDSDSLTSSFFSWHPNHRPPPLHSIQTGHVVTASEFYLFYSSILLLIIAVSLVGASLWSILFKSAFAVLIDTSTELACFSLPGAALCLPCSWIILSVHNDSKSYRFLPLVFLLLTFSAVLIAIGVYVGFTHKLRDPEAEDLRPNMSRSLKMFERNDRVRRAWDRLQSSWLCCGVDDSSDWVRTGVGIPASCHNTGTRHYSPSSNGCLKVIIAALTLQIRLFNGVNCVALVIMVISRY